jgi:hypothetical protein
MYDGLLGPSTFKPGDVRNIIQWAPQSCLTVCMVAVGHNNIIADGCMRAVGHNLVVCPWPRSAVGLHTYDRRSRENMSDTSNSREAKILPVFLSIPTIHKISNFIHQIHSHPLSYIHVHSQLQCPFPFTKTRFTMPNHIYM